MYYSVNDDELEELARKTREGISTQKYVLYVIESILCSNCKHYNTSVDFEGCNHEECRCCRKEGV